MYCSSISVTYTFFPLFFLDLYIHKRRVCSSIGESFERKLMVCYIFLFLSSVMFWIDCFGMNGGNYLPSLSIHSQSHCLPSPSRISPRSPVSTSGSESGERYSRKVFVGGLPPDIDEGIVCFSEERKTRISGIPFWNNNNNKKKKYGIFANSS